MHRAHTHKVSTDIVRYNRDLFNVTLALRKTMRESRPFFFDLSVLALFPFIVRSFFVRLHIVRAFCTEWLGICRLFQSELNWFFAIRIIVENTFFSPRKLRIFCGLLLCRPVRWKAPLKRKTKVAHIMNGTYINNSDFQALNSSESEWRKPVNARVREE